MKHRRSANQVALSCHHPGYDHLSREIQSEMGSSGICPFCDGPMTARFGRRGPYFHCACFEEPRVYVVAIVRHSRTSNEPAEWTAAGG